MFGEVPRHDVGQRDLFEDGPFVGAQRDPDLLQRLGHAGIADVLRPLAPYAEQLAVDDPDDVREGDGAGRPGQPEAAVRSALAADQPGPPQLGEDRLQELPRYLLSAGQLIGGDVSGIGRGEFDGSAQRVVGPG